MFRAGVVARAASRSATVNRESWFKQHLAYGQVIKKNNYRGQELKIIFVITLTICRFVHIVRGYDMASATRVFVMSGQIWGSFYEAQSLE